MRFFQLPPQARLAVGHHGESEKAILEVTGQEETVLQVLGRLALSVQQPLYLLDNVIAAGQEELEEFDVCLKRHLARTRSGWRLFRGRKRMKGQASKQFQARSRLRKVRPLDIG